MPKILITGNYCAANRGDAAILEGLIGSLRDTVPAAEISVSSFYPELAAKVHGVPAVPPLFPTGRSGLPPAAAVRRLLLCLAWAKGPLREAAAHRLDPQTRAALALLQGADVVVGAGGTYLNDNYRPEILGRLLELYLATALGKPVVLCGHSIGPFRSRWYTALAAHTLRRVDRIGVRDAASAALLAGMRVPRARVERVGDTAFLLRSIDPSQAEALIAREWPDFDPGRDHVSVSVREWAFYGRDDPARARERYLDAVAALCDRLVERYGVRVVFLSTCTDLGGYRFDDRLAAEAVRARMARPEAARVVAGELSAEQLIGVFGMMRMHVGTRMHSNILAMMGGTPAVAIAYEFKTTELMRQLGLETYVEDIGTISADGLIARAERLWRERAEVAPRLAAGVARMRAEARRNADRVREILAARAEGGAR